MKKPKKPAAWKNSFYWFAGLLFIVSIIGFVRGEGTIRDPGQVQESGLSFFYLAGAVIMVLNGWMTHQQAVKAFQEEEDNRD
jgi:hypothetical protein